ncbi:MAG: hypothetical protein GY807_20855 [Gammaproteobacteria bacterium]|nr:hypothetical protein [Gammaproteobacteria bacterium]
MPEKYVKTLLLTVILGLSAIASFNWFFNPYELFEPPRIQGVNVEKKEARNRRMYKAYAVVEGTYDALILGSSRALALDPLHEGFRGLNAYNLALSWGSTYEAYRYLEHAFNSSSKKIKTVILQISCCDGFGKSTYKGFNESRLVNKPGKIYSFDRLFTYLNDLVPALISIDALRASRDVFKHNKIIKHLIHNHKIQWHKERVRKAGGHRQMFNDLMSVMHPRKEHVNKVISAGYFGSILHFSHKHDIELIVYLSPFHARYEELYRYKSNGNMSDSWKRSLILHNESIAKKLNRTPYKIWGFTGYNSVTTEPIPGPGDTESTMKWYWEGSHITSDAANLVLDRILNYQHKNRNIPIDFGTLLNSSAIQYNLDKDRENRIKYQKQFPGEVAEIQRYLDARLNID